MHTLVSSKGHWTDNESLQWYATTEYVRAHPDDADLPELLERVAKDKSHIEVGATLWGGDLRV